MGKEVTIALGIGATVVSGVVCILDIVVLVLIDANNDSVNDAIVTLVIALFAGLISLGLATVAVAATIVQVTSKSFFRSNNAFIICSILNGIGCASSFVNVIFPWWSPAVSIGLTGTCFVTFLAAVIAEGLTMSKVQTAPPVVSMAPVVSQPPPPQVVVYAAPAGGVYPAPPPPGQPVVAYPPPPAPGIAYPQPVV